MWLLPANPPHFLGIAISAGKNRTVCIPFSPNAGNKPPSWQHLRLMYAFRDSDDKILVSCVHFQAQSGDSECVARKSCRQGPLFASRCPKSYMAHDSCHGDCPPLRFARGMCRHGPSRVPGETLVSTERIPGQAHFWIACWAVWVSGRCGIVQATFSKLQLQIGGRASSRVLLPKKRRHFEGNVGCCVRRSHDSITFL